MTATCVECGATFQRPPSHLARVKAPTCSQRCKGMLRGRAWATYGHLGPKAKTPESYASASAKMMGPLNPAWRGGATYRRQHGNHEGARYVRCPAWALPMARKDGYVMEHRLRMAEMCGFLLTRTEVVHHRDHRPLNNDSANLELWPTNRLHKLAEHGRPVDGAANRWCPTASGPL